MSHQQDGVLLAQKNTRDNQQGWFDQPPTNHTKAKHKPPRSSDMLYVHSFQKKKLTNGIQVQARRRHTVLCLPVSVIEASAVNPQPGTLKDRITALGRVVITAVVPHCMFKLICEEIRVLGQRPF